MIHMSQEDPEDRGCGASWPTLCGRVLGRGHHTGDGVCPRRREDSSEWMREQVSCDICLLMLMAEGYDAETKEKEG